MRVLGIDPGLRVTGYGVAELALASGGLLVSIACFAGLLRR